MKRNVWFVLWFGLVLVVLLAAFLFASYTSYNDEKTEEYFYKINSMIKDMDFYTAKAYENKIALYNTEQEMIKEIPFEAYDSDIKFIYARKKDAAIYFITSGAVDDEQGILFVNDDSADFLDGIKRMNRIGGNSYRYSTN